ncbi:response regulator [Dyadobacter sp. CY356]|uniref:response regulator n=1 Tax=Dyadobacter sp. CY356 TaxID=2906442 RepID=UPI001F227386|nr:response regulator [Dyadobacter sp. CY356]MCF0055835.1 response regulator [Dyadobacter sp. CY356]
MSKYGPIISIEDDHDDQYLLKSVLEEMNIANPVYFFENGLEAFNFLEVTTEQPFLILCDINMPVMNGLELRQRIDENPYLKKKAIPFIFLSTSGSLPLIDEAYKSTIQGFYKKGSSFQDFKKQIELIVAYWEACLHPNTRL